jgi:hypothetical protein
MFATLRGGKGSTMIIVDLLPWIALLVFGVAAGAEPAARLWHRVTTTPARTRRRHVPRHLHGSRA